MTTSPPSLRRLAPLALLFALIVLPSQDVRGQALADTWTSPPIEGEAHERHESAFVQAGNKYYLLGGRGIKPTDVYDPQTQTWTEAAATPVELHHFQAVAYDGLVLVLGAFSGPYPYETPASHVFVYDPAQDRWGVGPEIPAHRRRGAAGVAVHEGKVYLVGGIANGHVSHWVPWLDEFDPATNAWRELPDAPRARDHFQAAVTGGKLYAAGGRRSNAGETVFGATVAEVDVYDFASESWSTLPPEGNLPTERAGTTTVVVDGELLVIGGESAAQAEGHDEVEALDVQTGTWRTFPPLETGRHGMQAVVNPQGLFVAGGSADRGGGPEIVALEGLLREGDTTDVGAPLMPGTLALEDVQTSASGSARVTVTNEGGQALLVTHALTIGGATVEAPYGFPYILRPDSTLTVTAAFDAEASDTTRLGARQGAAEGGARRRAAAARGVGASNRPRRAAFETEQPFTQNLVRAQRVFRATTAPNESPLPRWERDRVRAIREGHAAEPVASSLSGCLLGGERTRSLASSHKRPVRNVPARAA